MKGLREMDTRLILRGCQHILLVFIHLYGHVTIWNTPSKHWMRKKGDMAAKKDRPHQVIPLTSIALLMNSACYRTSSSSPTLNHSFAMPSVAILEMATQLKTIGDTLDNIQNTPLVRIRSPKFLKWCVRVLHVIYESIFWYTSTLLAWHSQLIDTS